MNFKLIKTILLNLTIVLIVTSSIILYSFLYCFPKGSVILQPVGGLGNQLFQYAAAYSLAKKTNSKLFILINKDAEENGYNRKYTPNGDYALNEFSIPKEHIIYTNFINKYYVDKVLATSPSDPLSLSSRKTTLIEKLIIKILNAEVVGNTNFFSLSAKQNKKRLLMRDYFVSEIFFEDIKTDIKKLFTLRNFDNDRIQPIIKQISHKDSVCLHLRRGDMVKAGVFIPEYEKQAIDLIKILIDKPKFFIFSDDINTAKKESLKLFNSHLIEGFSTIEEFAIMSKCNNIIIPLSTFSWWAAYLNHNKNNLVIAPYNIHLESSYSAYDSEEESYGHRAAAARAYPKNWILIDYSANKQIIKDSLTNLHSSLLLNNQNKKFHLYTGDRIELSLCKNNGDFKSDFCIANNKLLNRAPTIVTAYYPTSPKDIFSINYLRNFLHIHFNLIIYTNKQNAATIREMRENLSITIVEEDINLFINNDNKINFVNKAIKNNPYHSTFFIWSDIGLIKSFYNNPFFLNDKFMHQGQMSFMSIKSNYKQKNTAKLASNIQIGDMTSWELYNKLWDSNYQSGDDETIIASISQKHPYLFNIIYQDPKNIQSGIRDKFDFIYYHSK